MSIKIVIVEDEPLISEDLAIILTKEGYNVVAQVYEGLEALDKIKSTSPDLVLLDISLGDSITGLDVAKHLKDTYKIPFIFITSFSDNYTLDQAKDLYPEGFIVKPFKKRDILASVAMTAHKIKSQSKSMFLSLAEINSKLFDHITPKEYEILLDLCGGLSNSDIATKHFITVNTVKTHLKRTFIKMNIDSRLQVSQQLLRK